MLGNHDQSRIAARAGPDGARLAAMLLLTLRGTPTLYYGDEIGMDDVGVPPERVRDPWELNMPGTGEGRDPVRTPMRWDGSARAGFCPDEVEPWLPVGDDVKSVNVAAQTGDAGSMLELHRRLLRLRRARPLLSRGGYARIDVEGDTLLYERIDDERTLVALNLGNTPHALSPPGASSSQRLLSTHPAGGADAEAVRAREGVVLALGYDVVGLCSSGSEALELHRKTAADVVLMDIRLRGELDGIETAVRLSRPERTAVIYLTGHAGNATIARARSTRPSGFLIKPCSERDL